ncbi:TetR/AcrR family transcriptional regulator C-terminal domain-containing protein [Crossiella cryophila]|uniref:AcrR family transcriptional regulator n=1 Tax=Crossiella cryophila TaxID=43355 RepID=A0A7W7CG45_9PSEU|nr:TetR/AcrR family transcriptional regulator C-terminal domain-containing protein [Crossiella cryophila]MBB4679201.1 AcrR family transcriptional regulator [Crossiella cryophila]
MALDRETVVRTALEVLDEVGLDALTLRRIATSLEVQAPALYWHFKNKQELVDEMATQVLRAAHEPPEEGLDWREIARRSGVGLRRALLAHRDGARMVAGTHLTDTSAYDSMERALSTFTKAGFSLSAAISGLTTIYHFTVGFVIEEQAVHPTPAERDPRYDFAARAARMDTAATPLAVAAGKELFSDFDRRYRQGLELIVRGLAG